MLSTDTTILEILNDAKKDGNQLLAPFIIQHPSKRVAEESNSIFVAVVSSENNLDGFDFNTFTDLVEILIVTKQQDYQLAIQIIKTISYEICRLIMENQHLFPNKPVIRNINPEFNMDFVLTRGHIMVQVHTEPVDYSLKEEDYRKVCEILLDDDYVREV